MNTFRINMPQIAASIDRQALSYYLHAFTHLKVAIVAGQPAPHKPILLIAILEGIEKGEITDNKIYITPELVARFKDLWHQLVHYPKFTANFALPFFHLQGPNRKKAFWHLKTKPGREILLTSSASIKSFAHLKEVVDHACFNDDLFELLLQRESRQKLKGALFQRWFPNIHSVRTANGLYEVITAQVLDNTLSPLPSLLEVNDEEITYIRGSIFKKEVPRVYNYACGISGMRVIADRQLQMIDACHIIPFAESGDDHISNGIALCPNLHRAFDRGLISIDANFKVIATSFTEAQADYLIRPFVGRRLLLPSDQKYWPAQSKLELHRQKFGFV
ncbi:HNH endonuclease [Flaviaesturariibacter amylovorans]|uniref:HNH endonuclease n=1 Tax=Flaviaesturariibacter amylovorans TaxID=1084520 RepID=A0ABP8HIA4_9BACT